MHIICEHCGEDNLLVTKKIVMRKSKAKRITHCKNCGNKILLPAVQRFPDSKYNQLL